MEMNTIEDWEKWAELARQDPEKFERERVMIIEDLIMSQPPERRHRSRQLQWKIDAVRQTSPNALYACIKIYDLLMDSVYGPKGLLQATDALGKICRETYSADNSIGKTATILPFKSKKGVE